MLSCVIIDDEQFSIDAIKRYIDMLPNLNIAGIYTDPQTALEDFSTKSYVDVLFMDIDMPLISGLELAKVLRPQTRKLIFTTSHSKYAFDAFEVDGDAFLLKPFSFLKFSTVVNRLFQNEQLDKVKSMGTNSDYFLVKNKEEDLRILKIKFNEVIAFESFNNYVKIYLTTEKVVVSYLTIKDVLDLLGKHDGFKQFHRAFVISTDCINYIQGNTIKMFNNLTFNVGENFKDTFNNFLSSKLLKTTRNFKIGNDKPVQ